MLFITVSRVLIPNIIALWKSIIGIAFTNPICARICRTKAYTVINQGKAVNGVWARYTARYFSYKPTFYFARRRKVAKRNITYRYFFDNILTVTACVALVKRCKMRISF